MTSKVKSILAALVAVLIGIVVLAGLNSLFFHWEIPISSETETQVLPAEPAQVVKIEPIVLDCRARISARVPIQGKRDYRFSVLGATQTYRTDQVKLTASGDVDTCVRQGAKVEETSDGGWRVVIPASSIEFSRPRVDAGATASSVSFQKGWVGKLTDSFPWVSDNNQLTPAGYAYAQNIIGGSSCMKVAWSKTKAAVTAAYQDQAVSKGLSASQVEVSVTGSPDFNQNDNTTQSSAFKDFKFRVRAGEVKCLVLPEAFR